MKAWVSTSLHGTVMYATFHRQEIIQKDEVVIAFPLGLKKESPKDIMLEAVEEMGLKPGDSFAVDINLTKKGKKCQRSSPKKRKNREA